MILQFYLWIQWNLDSFCVLSQSFCGKFKIIWVRTPGSPTFRMYELCMHHVWCSFILLKSKNSTMSDVSDVKKVDTTKIPFQVSSQVGLQHFSFSCQNPPPILPLPCYHPAHWHQCHHSFHNHHPSQNYLFNHVSSIFHVLLVVE